MGLFGDITSGLEAVGTGGLSTVFNAPGNMGLSQIIGGSSPLGSYGPLLAGGAVGTALGNPAMGLQYGMQMSSAEQAANAVKEQNQMQMAMAMQAENFSSAQAARQMSFQQEMSDTSFERGAAGMIRAGINPMLAAGTPASTPSGAAASGVMPSIEAVPGIMTTMLNGGKAAVDTLQGLNESMSRVAANRASAGLAAMSTEEKSASAYIEGLIKKVLEFSVSTGKQLFNSAQPVMDRGASELSGTPLGVSNVGLGQ